jgi:hypothetical protein
MLNGMPIIPAPTIVLMKLNDVLATELSPPSRTSFDTKLSLEHSNEVFKGDSSSCFVGSEIGLKSCSWTSSSQSLDGMLKGEQAIRTAIVKACCWTQWRDRLNFETKRQIPCTLTTFSTCAAAAVLRRAQHENKESAATTRRPFSDYTARLVLVLFLPRSSCSGTNSWSLLPRFFYSNNF